MEYPGQAPCPHCFESSGYAARHHYATWDDPAWSDSDPTSPCPYCNATGTVDSPLATLEDLEDLAAEEEGALIAHYNPSYQPSSTVNETQAKAGTDSE
jgi:hypothetical protein